MTPRECQGRPQCDSASTNLLKSFAVQQDLESGERAHAPHIQFVETTCPDMIRSEIHWSFYNFIRDPFNNLHWVHLPQSFSIRMVPESEGREFYSVESQPFPYESQNSCPGSGSQHIGKGPPGLVERFLDAVQVFILSLPHT
jgi:hypothetical protein